ncbi:MULTISPECIES: dihydroxyacetone kinase phosphoryl donor subunit DhaM [Clostridium]|mgnify:CR=1 FL=1|jgi:dihydroxyacetone kinase DhaM subunit (EC 2.7.1.121)|uniref:phosphoenolpyruvate--glycerone phosphotransferase n=4 Tax=Clostridium TaxID=1485 RepID=A0AAV3W434_9CLOT|nr:MULTISPECIES: dihydroxyacetone kinase phosphoryl donor subunit DhaM [Clostridium]ABR34317.1 dihydroxyacetone kinase, phosphotransfer subunit [Clostridium beijerinckii NCIMB 8052]AIU04242.1 phosphotransferase mannnose-specific family component IIA [Clostridium beijerinckii ATCC 35702]AVK51101.1 PTS mannose transporter subunit IID [Clostridium sp. MF28]MBF7811070.1 PTS-dependent dihydroxyacetone kinase phosphotransferase subunit DhaM [Clostridium beijerinckii]NRT24374.1 dihydroxyacetone kinas
MVGIVIISHSKNIADGVKELASQMAPNVAIGVAGGTADGRVGTDMDKISAAIEDVYSEDGVIIIFDLGSAFMNAEMAIEFLDEKMKEKIKIVDCPIVEGAVTAAVESSIGKNIEEIEEALKPMNLGKMP